MYNCFFACFHTIFPESSRLGENAFFHAFIILKLLVSLIGCPIACSATIAMDRQTDRHTHTHIHRPNTVTLAAHAHQWVLDKFKQLSTVHAYIKQAQKSACAAHFMYVREHAVLVLRSAGGQCQSTMLVKVHAFPVKAGARRRAQ